VQIILVETDAPQHIKVGALSHPLTQRNELARAALPYVYKATTAHREVVAANFLRPDNFEVIRTKIRPLNSSRDEVYELDRRAAAILREKVDRVLTGFQCISDVGEKSVGGGVGKTALRLGNIILFFLFFFTRIGLRVSVIGICMGSRDASVGSAAAKCCFEKGESCGGATGGGAKSSRRIALLQNVGVFRLPAGGSLLARVGGLRVADR